MDKFLNKIERKIGRYAVENLSLYIIIGYVIGYLLSISGTLEFISLNPYKILHGQVWRILTWILVPPSSFDVFTIIMLFFYYQIGTSLERKWGTFRFNIYIFSGIIFSIIGAFILYFISISIDGSEAAFILGQKVSSGFSTYYINLSIFLAFAVTYPDMQVLLFFVIPVKMKWLGIFDAILIAYSFAMSGASGRRFAIIMSLLNFILFFFGSQSFMRVNPKEVYRRQKFKRATSNSNHSFGDQGSFKGFSSNRTPSGISKHKCAICGLTEKDNENLEFRFCSKCNGNYEYCSNHLFTHEHIK